MKVFAFDIGLRNLAAVVISQSPGFSFSDLPQFKTYTSADETLDAFKLRALQYFLRHGWVIEQWDLVDVSEVLERDVKNVKRLSDVSKSIALADTLQALEDKWFADSAPDVVCVETQHNANAIMRGVGIGTLVFFRRSFPETVLESKSGSHKLKICDALGVGEGAGLVPGQEKKAAAAEKKALKEQKRTERAKRKQPSASLFSLELQTGPGSSFVSEFGSEPRMPAGSGHALEQRVVKGVGFGPAFELEPRVVKGVGFGPAFELEPRVVSGVGSGPASGLEPTLESKSQPTTRTASVTPKTRRQLGTRHFKSTGKKKEKYEDNKIRAVMAVAVLMPDGHEVLRLHSKKQDDLCDVLLMALWVLWCRVSPRAPVKKRTRKETKETKETPAT